MSPKKSGHDRLIDQLKVVSDRVNKGIIPTLIENNLGPSTNDNVYKAHTVLKLIFHCYVFNYIVGIPIFNIRVFYP